MPSIVSRVFEKLRSLRIHDSRKLYALPEQVHLRRLLHSFDIDCVFDVGANYGQYARMLRSHAGFKGLIVSFEPIPDAAAELRRLARGDDRWVIEEFALGAQEGVQNFHIMNDSQFSSLSEPEHSEVPAFREWNSPARTVPVAVDTLNSAFRRLQEKHAFKRPFLKMDTQGFDIEVLKGGADVARKFLGLQSELAIKKLYQQSVDYREALAIYESLDFELSAFVPNNVGHFPVLVEMDCIMIRRDLAGAPR
jgi:FkbM family methyltransferase